MILADPDHLLGESVEIPPELRDALCEIIRRHRGKVCSATITLHFGRGRALRAVTDEPCPDSTRARRYERIICGRE